MGQRLNIEIINDNGILANCYYHWSGYTLASIDLLKQIIEEIGRKESIKGNVEEAIALLRHTGAEFNHEAWEEAFKEGLVLSSEAPQCKGRTCGLIAVTANSMRETRKWEEGRITINLDQLTFLFRCAQELDYLSEDKEIWSRVKDLFVEIEIPTHNYWTTFAGVDALLEGVWKAEKEKEGRFTINGTAFLSIY